MDPTSFYVVREFIQHHVGEPKEKYADGATDLAEQRHELAADSVKRTCESGERLTRS